MTKRNPERQPSRQERWQDRNKQARWAHNALRSAIKAGIVEPRPCEVCGDPKSEGHHDDYSKPAEVRWLCRMHHRELHAAIREVA